MKMAIILSSLLFSAFFSGMEIAFISANRLRIELDRKQGNVISRLLAIFVKNPQQYIATMLVGNNIALVVYGIFMALLLEPFIMQFTSSEFGILFLQTIISTIIILFIAEFIPKAIFRINPNLSLNIFSVPVLVFYILFYPVARFAIIITEFFLKRVLKKEVGVYAPAVFNKIDLTDLVSDTGIKPDVIQTSNDIKIFQNALDFSSLKVRDCMIPRTDITAVEVNSNVEEVKEKFIETGFSKILVYEDNIDNIIGYVSLKELFNQPGDIRSQLIKISYVPETMSASKLLRQFIQNRKNIAVVVDEFGGISGMLTIEDIIEEIFGDIEDEHDVVELIERQIDANQFIFSGRLEIEHINEHYKLDLEESEDYDTLAGYIIFHYEKIPVLHEHIAIDKYEFKILKVTETKIELVHVKRREK